MPKMSGFSDRDKIQIEKQAVNFWETSTTADSTFYDDVSEFERLSRGKLPLEVEAYFSKRKDKSALSPPTIFINLKSLKSGLRTLLFSEKPYGKISHFGQPGLRDDRIVKAEATLQDIIDTGGFEEEGSMAMRQALYAGIGCGMVEWHKEYARQVQKDQNGQPVYDESGYPVMENTLVAEYPRSVARDIRRVRVDGVAESFRKSRIVGYQSLVPLTDLLALNRDETSHVMFDEKQFANSRPDLTKYYQFIQGDVARYPNMQNDQSMYTEPNVEIWDIRGIFKIVGEDGSIRYEDLVVWIANQTKMIGLKKNDLPIAGWDIFDFPIIDRELSTRYPMGVVAPAFDLWMEEFIKRNLSSDEANRRVHRKYVADRNAWGELPDIIENEADLVLKLDTQASGLQSIDDAFRPIPVEPVGQDVFAQSQIVKREQQQVMGLNDYIQGTDPSGTETATAVDALVSGGRSNMADIANNLKDSYLVPQWKKMLILWNHYKGHKENQVTDHSGQMHTIAPNELGFLFTIDIEINTNADRPAMQRRLVEMFPVLTTNPHIDLYELTRTYLDILKVPNADRIMLPNELLQATIENENAAMIEGVSLPVHPAEIHQKHMEGHIEGVNWLASPEAMQALSPDQIRIANEVFQEHMMGHEAELEKQATALGNTKEMGGNTGNLSQPDSAATKKFSPLVGQRR